MLARVQQRVSHRRWEYINNVIVNGINHRYDPHAFIRAMPADRIRYFHLAGHYVEAPDLRVDTHGDAVGDAAWDLLADAYALFGPVPTLLERDFNFPPMEALLDEVRRIRRMQSATTSRSAEPARG